MKNILSNLKWAASVNYATFYTTLANALKDDNFNKWLQNLTGRKNHIYVTSTFDEIVKKAFEYFR